MCVTGHALLSALVARLAKGGRPATEGELAALLGSGCPEGDVRAALAREGDAFAEARAALERVLASRPR